MAHDPHKAGEQWERYTYMRDAGHLDFVHKADRCEEFFAGNQWDPIDLAALREQQRPALTINKILITLSSIFGEQIQNRAEVTFKPRMGADSSQADILAKVWRFISDSNQYQWKRDEVFSDGAITSRGFFEVRMDFSRNTTGDIIITRENSKNVITDPDADEYDPDEWNDVIKSKWMTADDISLLYSEDDAAALKERVQSAYAYGYDSIDHNRDRFGGRYISGFNPISTDTSVIRNIRVLERQFRMLKRVQFFVDPRTGDRREIPDGWERNRIAWVAEQSGLLVMTDRVKKIRWRVTADDFVLHDEWSPYRHFTLVPFFPYFRHGRTIGLVENLLDPQELLNKVSSQELHVVNTTANSGWKVRRGSLKNMTIDELETEGAKTGLVLELDDVEDAEKIQPNQYPTGLDRISFKAEEHVKTISGRGDSQLGLDRADVAARATEAKNAIGQVNLLPVIQNLERTDWLLARNVLSLVQDFYSDPRIMTITRDVLTGETEEIRVNWPDPESGEIMNDITRGEYEITVVSQPARRTLEESQFNQALTMRTEADIQIPDRYIIQNSNLMGKSELIKAMEEQANSSEAQFQQQIEALNAKLTVANLKAETSRVEADATLKQAKAEKELANTMALSKQNAGEDPELMKMEREMELKERMAQQELAMKQRELEMKLEMQRRESEQKLQLQRMEAEENARLKRAQAILVAKQAAKNPAQQNQPQGA